MNRVVIAYLDHESKPRAIVAEVNMNAPAEKRDAAVHRAVEARSPGYIKIRNYYREPQGRRGKL